MLQPEQFRRCWENWLTSRLKATAAAEKTIIMVMKSCHMVYRIRLPIWYTVKETSQASKVV